jgi:hypothetical protein
MAGVYDFYNGDELMTNRVIVALVASGFALSGITSVADDIKVMAQPVLEINSSHGTFYRVTFDYDFSPRNSVEISGLGTVSAKGHLSYLTQEPIEFRDSDGSLLHKISINDPIRLMGSQRLQIPEIDEFPQVALFGRIQNLEKFRHRALAILMERFPLGIRPFQTKKTNHILTSYHEIGGAVDGLYTRVAILLSYPNSAEPASEFELRMKISVRRSHSGWRDPSDEDRIDTASMYQKQILTDLEGTQ